MHFPALGCYNSKHLNINVFATVVFKIPVKLTIVLPALLFVYIQANMSIVEFRKLCFFYAETNTHTCSETTQLLYL